MKTVNSVSGGKTSSYIAAKYPADYNIFSCVCIDDHRCAPKDKSLLLYAQAKLEKFYDRYGEFIATAEDDATIRVMMDLEQYIGKEITWVRGRSFDDIINSGKQTRLPSWARRYCTSFMKLEPIFYWWLMEIGEKCNMRIGFRADEYDRMERFFNNSDPGNYSIPVYCSTKGKKRQVHQEFNWRFCHFPLIKDGVTKQQIDDYWKGKRVSGDLFNESRPMTFPVVSNCVGCFHKKPETLSVMSVLHPEKMNWFAEQEDKEMGTWLDSRITYRQIMANSDGWIPEMIKEGSTCDSGGCHD